jgi:hypothetical protein
MDMFLSSHKINITLLFVSVQESLTYVASKIVSDAARACVRLTGAGKYI